MKTEVTELLSNGVAKVAESNQSNLIPWVFANWGEVPEREATRTWLPFAESNGATRDATLPVPPISRTVLRSCCDILVVDVVMYSTVCQCCRNDLSFNLDVRYDLCRFE